MASIEQRLLRAWKKKRGIRLSAAEVEMLMHRGLEYLQTEDADAMPALPPEMIARLATRQIPGPEMRAAKEC